MRALVLALACLLPAPQAAPWLLPAEQETPHLVATIVPATAPVTPGAAATLALEIRPKRGMRLYAPGSPGYLAVGVSLDPSPHVAAGSVRLPAATDYVFPPTQERARVFDAPFRLELPVKIATGAATRKAAAAPGARLTVRATLEYQACDDRTCYRPARVPVAWTLDLRPASASKAGPGAGAVR